MKLNYGVKTNILLTAGACTDNLIAWTTVSAAFTATSSPVPDYFGIRDFRAQLMLKNVSTYQLRVRVTTWVCRRSLRSDPLPSIYNSLDSMLIGGYAAPYANQPPGFNAASATNVSSTFFQNPIWVQYFKAIKVKKYTLMPYRTRNESLHILKKRPGLIWKNGNGGSGGTNDNGQMLCHKDGGITTCVKSIEIVGEITNDGETFPDTLVGTSAGVLLLQNQVDYEAAASQAAAKFYSTGDPNPGAGTGDTLTGQPWNYLFPTPGTNTYGSSSVIGAMSSGR